MEIKQALGLLDHTVDEHWTSDGLPLVEAVSALIGRPAKRGEITAAAPSFNRAFAASRAQSSVPVAPAKRTATQGAELGDEDEGGDEGPGDEPLELPDADPSSAEPEDEGGADDEGDGFGIDRPADDEDRAPQPAAPAAQPAIAAQVAPERSTLTMSAREVLASPELTARAWQEIEAKLADLRTAREEIDAELKKLNGRAEVLSRNLERLQKLDPNAAIRDIRAYLQRGQASREERVRRARAFIDAKTTARDVAEQLTGTSKLDHAMARKTARGQLRPRYPELAGAAPAKGAG